MIATTGANGHLAKQQLIFLFNKTKPAQIVAMVRDIKKSEDLRAWNCSKSRCLRKPSRQWQAWPKPSSIMKSTTPTRLWKNYWEENPSG